MPNFKKVKLTEGKFKGYTAVFETEGEEVTVYCPACGWSSWQIFFIKNYTEKDIHRDCPDCGGKLKIKE